MQRAFIPTDGYDFYVFQSSPARGGGCNDARRPSTCILLSFNPHPPVGAGATLVEESFDVGVAFVSILTRPWGRVQPANKRADRSADKVSILTRPWGRVQHTPATATYNQPTRFNPHPPVGAGATRGLERRLPVGVSILTRPWGRVQRRRSASRPARACRFNPHPPVEAGAT